MRPETQPDLKKSAPTIVARRAPVLWVAAAVLAGYLGATAWPDAPVGVWAGFALVLAAGALGLAMVAPRPEWRDRKFAVGWGACFLVAGTLLAWAWHETRVRTPATDWATLPEREATLTLRVAHNFARRADTDYVGGLAEVVDAPDVFNELRGLVVLYNVRVPAGVAPPARGAIIVEKGVLEYLPTLAPDPADPTADSAARFRAYLHAQGAWFELARGRVQSTVAPPNAWTKWLAAQHARLEAIFRHGPTGLENDYGNIYIALLLGEPALLDPAQRSALTISGGIYLFAISGLHVGVLSLAVWWVLRRTPGLPHAVGELITLSVAWLYVEIAGDTTSGRRVALMLTFYLIGKWLGRARSPLAAVVAAGVTMLVVDPLVLNNSGFELSFTVVLGLILYAPLLYAAVETRWRPWRDVPESSFAPWQKCFVWLWEKLVGLAVTSWTAMLGSAPLMAEFSGTFSAPILFLNLLLFPLTCVALWAGTLAVAAGLVGLAPLTWISWLANGVGLTTVGLMQETVSIVPARFHTQVEIMPLWTGSLAALAVLLAMLLAQPKDRAPRWWYFALPVAILAITAVLTVRAV
jgi:competence protein ComEC